MNNAHDECQQGESHDERLALPIEQGVLLWCMRMWVIEMKRGIGLEGRIDNMLDALDAPFASSYLKGFMFALSHGCTRMIEVRCVCRKRISVDEQALLDVLSLAQAMRSFEALLVLRGFMTQAGADAALRSAEGIGTVLAQTGRFLPEPEEEVRHYALSATAGVARPPNTTLH